MRVLLTDGSGLTARQCAAILSQDGHTVEVLSSERLCLCRFTRHVRRVHRVPPFGVDPFGWLDAALAIYRRGGFDVLLATQEQTAVLAATPDRLSAAGVACAIPSFTALARVQDKLSACATLDEIGVPQPVSAIITSSRALAAWRDFPVYLKTPIGTAQTGIRRLDCAAELRSLDRAWVVAAEHGGLLAQHAVEGELVMVQSVFDHGRLAAFHANQRVREGVRGGASHKQSLHLPAARDHMARLGEWLAWHGALSADLILSHDGPLFIDINPRLVEPGNARRAGVDLLAPLLDIARGRTPASQAHGVPGIRTHQLLLAVLGAAAYRASRQDIVAEIITAAARRGLYHASSEELTPRLGSDPCALTLLAATALTVLTTPSAWRWFAQGSVTAYALTADSWSQITDHSWRREPDEQGGPS